MASLFGPPIGQSHDEFRADSGSNSNPIVPRCLRATIVSEIDWPCPVPLPTPFVVKKGSKTLGGLVFGHSRCGYLRAHFQIRSLEEFQAVATGLGPLANLHQNRCQPRSDGYPLQAASRLPVPLGRYGWPRSSAIGVVPAGGPSGPGLLPGSVVVTAMRFAPQFERNNTENYLILFLRYLVFINNEFG